MVGYGVLDCVSGAYGIYGGSTCQKMVWMVDALASELFQINSRWVRVYNLYNISGQTKHFPLW
jgi:hypothetical protein